MVFQPTEAHMKFFPFVEENRFLKMQKLTALEKGRPGRRQVAWAHHEALGTLPKKGGRPL